MAMAPVLAPAYVEPLLGARRAGKPSAVTSLDLGLTRVEVGLTADGVTLPGGETLAWEDIERIAGATTGNLGGRCFALRDGEIDEIQVFSEATNRRYSLLATPAAPTMLVAGVQMHRTKGTDPAADTKLKVRAIAPVIGRVLDSATGLGYTAIEAAKSAEQVITIELELAALEIARLNPWSRDLFENPKIRQRIGDSFDIVPTFPDGSFSRVIHDPPVFSLAGQLYSGEFYRQLFRVLKRGGRLFHYIGNVQSASGHRVTRGVVRRLQEAGFARIASRSEAFGLVAYK
ncbi:MAG: class I SAM-dependent methyltransferase [Chloroflexota bacterium]